MKGIVHIQLEGADIPQALCFEQSKPIMLTDNSKECTCQTCKVKEALLLLNYVFHRAKYLPAENGQITIQ